MTEMRQTDRSKIGSGDPTSDRQLKKQNCVIALKRFPDTIAPTNIPQSRAGPEPQHPID